MDKIDPSRFQLEHWRLKPIETQKPYTRMWDGNLETVSTTKHLFELIANAAPVSQSPYKAGLRQSLLETDVIDRIIEQDVSKPCSFEWASTIGFTMKKDVFLGFVSITEKEWDDDTGIVPDTSNGRVHRLAWP